MSAMSGDDTLPPTIPKRARTAVKRPDPIETKNRMKGTMNNLNKKDSQEAQERKERTITFGTFPEDTKSDKIKAFIDALPF